MEDQNKTKKQLISELMELRQRIVEFEALENDKKLIEKDIRNSLSLLNAALESTADGILVVDREGKIVSFNQKFVQMWNIPESIITSRDDDQALAFVLDQLKNPQGFLIKVRELYNQPDIESFDTLEFKDERVFERYSKPQWIGQQIIGRVWSFRDVTERKRMEEDLRKSEERFRELFDNAPVGYHEFDTEGRITHINRTELEMLGYTLEERIGQFVWNSIADEEKSSQMVLGKLAGVIPPSRGLERTYRRKDGTTFPALIQDQLIKDEKGRITGIRSTIQDITNLKQTEKALRESEDRYRDLVEFSQYLICTHDLKGHILSMNQRAAKLMGYDRSFILNKNLRDFLAPEVRGKFDTYLSTIQKQGVAKGVMLIQTATGEKRLWEYNNTLRIEGILEPIVRGMAHDITERKQMEQILIKNEKVAKRLSQENAIMAEIGRLISSTINIEEVYERFAEEVRKIIPFDRISVSTIDPASRSATMAYVWGTEVAGRNQGDVFSFTDSLYEELIAIRSGILIQVEDENELAKIYPNLLNTYRAGLRSMVSVPLISKDEVIGALHFRSLKPKAYTETDLKLAEKVGNQIAGAIANAQVFIEWKRVEKERERLILQLQGALVKVKQLSGMLPICTSCKKIRDDKGYWNQIEVYIRDHSETEFTHGICPECFKKLYPDESLEDL